MEEVIVKGRRSDREIYVRELNHNALQSALCAGQRTMSRSSEARKTRNMAV